MNNDTYILYLYTHVNSEEKSIVQVYFELGDVG